MASKMTTVCGHGQKTWYLNGERHRANGPAVIKYGNYKAWYLNGKRHNIGSPAVLYNNGSTTWYVNGDRHRVDGPAITFFSGDLFWFVNGKRCTSNDEFQDAAGISDRELALMVLRYGTIS